MVCVCEMGDDAFPKMYDSVIHTQRVWTITSMYTYEDMTPASSKIIQHQTRSRFQILNNAGIIHVITSHLHMHNLQKCETPWDKSSNLQFERG